MDKLQRPGISLRAIAPNAVTAMALCTGLSGAWFAMQGRWEAAIAAIVGAGILDGMDGRIARMLKGESKFGAELDSLSDVTAFGVTPALVTYMWALQHMPRFGWSITVFFALCMALRLARFNARIDVQDQPHKSAGFNTGVPAPAGAGLALFPMIVWLEPAWISLATIIWSPPGCFLWPC
ncbi:MAG TPA: CDP-alcohol phosphatidyltransferase family protein [Sphingorhabdus sp.]|nr:CDP-alcohol phosphatidyltransferase family protein [Sphingorhabdus sp.]